MLTEWRRPRGRRVRALTTEVLEVGIVRLTKEVIYLRPWAGAIVADVPAFEAIAAAVLHGCADDYEWAVDGDSRWRPVTVSIAEREQAEGTELLRISPCGDDLCVGYRGCHAHAPHDEPVHFWRGHDDDGDPRWMTTVVRSGQAPWEAQLHVHAPLTGDSLGQLVAAVLAAQAGAQLLNGRGA